MPIAVILGALALATATPVAAQQHADRRDAAQIADSTAIAVLARQLTEQAGSDRERAAALYQWVATHLTWDVAGYLRGSTRAESAEVVYRRRIALCGGYVALYERLAREAGLEVEPIEGYAKGFDYVSGQSTKRNNHAWVAVRLNGGWRLVDPTWGSGHVADGRFVPQFSWSWFLVPADELILSHFPESTRWQLLAQPLRRRDFERMPAVPRELLDVGFDASAVRRTVVAGVRDFPLVGRPEQDVQVLRAPIAGTLPANAVIELDLIWPGATEVVLVSGDTWTPLSRSGDRFQGAAAAGSSTVYVVGRTPADAGYATLLHYTVR